MRAAVFLQRGPAERKQEQVCLEYIDLQRWQMRHVINHWSPDAAVALVRNGGVDVVVAAFRSKQLEVMAADIADAGQVIYVHPYPTIIRPPRRMLSTSDLILKWHGHGRTPHEMAVDLDADSDDVRAILRRHGKYPG